MKKDNWDFYSLLPTFGCCGLAIMSCLLLVSVFVDVPKILFAIPLYSYLLFGYVFVMFYFFASCRGFWIYTIKGNVPNKDDEDGLTYSSGMIIFGIASAIYNFFLLGWLFNL
jgi:hypothetical protein